MKRADLNKLKRMYIIGTMASGKTTLAKKISQRLNIPHYDLDEIFWKRKYDLKRSDKECRKLLEKLAKRKEWIIEGVFSKWVEPGMKRSQLIVWLDLKFATLAWRLIIRKLGRKSGQFKEKWSDTLRMLKQNFQYVNMEHLAKKQDNWAYKTRDTHTALMKKHKIPCIRLKKTKEIQEFLKTLH